ncbi:PorP/SprF family type IX secretion system membrane protein [Flagellimonas algicola]|uniref:Type IX secretion system membrane protein PorP/SprF n=1 Tax=Flagellimonas algicola TaxID=2583815 RepID=A0ABY2WP66_9FLAO|nr:PorP/SprF family type IX secretion system membrane protein [Allomuricauda algicola]TMU56792.1 type IX secretion system membrane protein PorP/SprF [Allomuricauda algicola]
MLKHLAWLLLLLPVSILRSQERTLPADFRQHNLSQFNASLLNPTFALDWNRPNAMSIWTRWQWQTVDGDPTTIFTNYTQLINSNAAAGVGFLQHNTGTFLNTGLNLNYVHAFPLENNIRIVVGANMFGFREKLADDRFIPNPDIELPELETTNDFILTFSPAVRLQVNQFNLGLSIENAIDVNFSESASGRGDGGTAVVGTISNDFPVSLFNGLGQSFVRPLLYLKSVPDGDTQFGINGLLSTSSFWVQGGYNSFYGISGGVGVTFANQFSIGGLIEKGTDNTLRDEKSTFELILSYHGAASDNRKKVVDFDWENDDELARLRMQEEEVRKQELENQKQEAENKRQEEENRKQEEENRKLKDEERRQLEEENRLAAELKRKEQERTAVEAKKKQDSIAAAALDTARLLAEQRRKDSIAKVQNEKVELQGNEKYEEVTSADGLEPGFYLIANVFGTKKYHDAFMTKLTKDGLNPKSFFRALNKYRYVYLGRYNTMNEARRARDSKLDGKYPDKTWIFRVRAK